MPLRSWFESKRKKQHVHLDPNGADSKLSDDELERLWTQCYKCSERFPTKDVEKNLMVCPQCDYHFRIGARERIKQLTDSFDEMDVHMRAGDPLDFVDTEAYPDKRKKAEAKTSSTEAIVTGVAHIGDTSFALAVMDFAYLGGSMGSVVGEKITRLIEHALEKELSLVIFSSSGGARMQEGVFSLMQMVKTGSALARFHEAGRFYISVLSEPTFGGVTASYGMLGDLNIAEQGARIGFAGRRVIEQTIRQKLPSGFQTANYLKKYGQLDMVVPRTALSQTLVELIRLHETSLELSASTQKERQPVGVNA